MNQRQSEKSYLQRIGAGNRALARATPPTSLQEAFDRMDDIESRLGRFAQGGQPGDGDLKSHLTYLERLRTVASRNT